MSTLTPQEQEVQDAINTIFSEDWQIVGKTGDVVGVNILNLMAQLGKDHPLTIAIITAIKENPQCHPRQIRFRQTALYS